MTTRIWDSSTGIFDSGADWSPQGVPQPGDVAVINAGAVTASGDFLQYLTIQVNGDGSNATTFALSDATLGATSSVSLNNSASFGVGAFVHFNVLGNSSNLGVVTMTGSVTDLILSADANNTQGFLYNNGAINAVGSSPQVGTTGTGTIANDGSIAIWNPNAVFQEPVFAIGITGTGAIVVEPNSSLDLNQAVGAGQTLRFDGGGSATSVAQIDDAAAFQASIEGMSSNNTLLLTNVPEASFSYTPVDADHGTLKLFSGANQTGSVLASLNMTGNYAQSSFAVTTNTLSNNEVNTTVRVNADQAQQINYTDVTLGLASSAAGSSYTGTVAGLQEQYSWYSADSVALRSNASSADLTGGNGSDAIQATGGSNIINGGLGSNFLVGATGGADTFYMDATSGVNWDTIVNFHPGDVAVLYGFNAGTSTVNWVGSDGAAGYTGVTLHSELGGGGTGFNGSVTFAGLSLGTQESNFTATVGAGYLQIAYT